MPPQAQISPERARAELWRRGDLYWKLHSGQQDIHNLIHSIEKRRRPRAVVRTARRFGKTFSLGAFAMQKCIQRPKTQIPFAAPTAKALKSIVLPQFNELLLTCPPHLRPKYKVQDGVFEFSNGSKIMLFGVDNQHAERIRGIRAHYYVIDEAGFMDGLKELILSILQPTLMYSDGYGIISSTPPTSPDHYFVELLHECEAEDSAIRKTVWENPLLTVKEILEHADATGSTVDWDRFKKENDEAKLNDMLWGESLILEKSIQFRREFEAEILVDPERAVIPEFTDAKAKQIVVPYEMPKFCNKFTILDTGFIDHTGVVFGYYDFINAKAVIQDDMLINFSEEGTNIEELCRRIRQKEEELWKGEVPRRRGDGDLIVLSEMSKYGLPVAAVKKDDLEAQVNQVRIDIQQDRLRICPAAQNVINHMKYAVWNRRRTQFERTEGHGHYDCLAATIYFLRHLDRHSNPWPENDGVDVFNQIVPEKETRHETLENIFRGR